VDTGSVLSPHTDFLLFAVNKRLKFGRSVGFYRQFRRAPRRGVA